MPSRTSRWQPAEVPAWTLPGTAPTGRLSPSAWWAVFCAPDRHRASTTTVPAERAAMIRLRWRKR